MYNSYFGFREKPFKLVPNPDYLYLSKSHQVALANLTYAVAQGDGFVVITGEVGTGKTTLCRIFLERLDDRTESAYIFNPRLDSIQLLDAICNEFGIRTNLSTVKQLLDVINGYLMMKNNGGRKVILLIDEAQNLSVENLEMVRMLSNLETTRSKLLQIILVGQPELGDKLDSYELRQLSQRISLSAHLTPFSPRETTGYIQHRINIAAQRQASIFTVAASQAIHRYTNGIPRMINIVCDRALLTAFSLDRQKVTHAIAKQAIREISSRGRAQLKWFHEFNRVWVYAVLGILFLAGVFSFKADLFPSHARSTHLDIPSTPLMYPIVAPAASDGSLTFHKNENRVSGNTASTPSAHGAVAEQRSLSTVSGLASSADIEAAIKQLDHRTSRLDAVTQVLARWRQPAPHAAQLPTMVNDQEYFDIAAHQYGLRAYQAHSDWGLVRQLNLPSIIAVKHPAADVIVYMALVGWNTGGMHLSGNDGRTIQVDLHTLMPYLQGPAFIYWKNVTGMDGIVSSSSPERSISTVKEMLHRLGYARLDAAPVFDIETQRAVVDFQMHHRLTPDGLVGPLTKILLIRNANAYEMPQLSGDVSGDDT